MFAGDTAITYEHEVGQDFVVINHGQELHSDMDGGVYPEVADVKIEYTDADGKYHFVEVRYD